MRRVDGRDLQRFSRSHAAVALAPMASSSDLHTTLSALCADIRVDESGVPQWSESWAALNFLCPDTLGKATEILDHKTVTRVFSKESGREFFLVEGEGKSKQSYAVLRGFCTCYNFAKDIAARPASLVCKHELAAKLAPAVSKLQQRELDDREWAKQCDMNLTMGMNDYGVNQNTEPEPFAAAPAPLALMPQSQA